MCTSEYTFILGYSINLENFSNYTIYMTMRDINYVFKWKIYVQSETQSTYNNSDKKIINKNLSPVTKKI